MATKQSARLIWRNTEGTEVVLTRQAPFYLSGFEGFGSVDNQVTATAVYGLDGEVKVDSRLLPRDIGLIGVIKVDSFDDLQRQKRNMLDAFNPKLTGTLTYEVLDSSYFIDCEVIQGPPNNTADAGSLYQKYDIQLKALDPYWRDTSMYDSLIPLASLEPRMRFPLVFKSDEPFIFGEYKSGDIRSVTNKGDVVVGGVFYMTAYAEVVNPRIYNVTQQQFFGFKGTYPAGTTFEISTVSGKLYARKNVTGIAENAMNDRLDGSVFLKLQKGDNYFQTQADNDTVNGLICSLKFTPLVAGV